MTMTSRVGLDLGWLVSGLGSNHSCQVSFYIHQFSLIDINKRLQLICSLGLKWKIKVWKARNHLWKIHLPPTPSTNVPNTTIVDFFEEPDFIPSIPIVELVTFTSPSLKNNSGRFSNGYLDGKRKIKPVNKDEKKQVGEEMAVLIHAESITLV